MRRRRRRPPPRWLLVVEWLFGLSDDVQGNWANLVLNLWKFLKGRPLWGGAAAAAGGQLGRGGGGGVMAMALNFYKS